jgi:molybdate transport system substrate-binding protein
MNSTKIPLRLLPAFSLIALILTAQPARAEEIIVSAATSLTDAMTRIGRDFSKQNPGATVRFNFGATGALQRQIENGAPADVFAAAGAKEMDVLARAGRIEPATRIDFTGNRLVLIVPLKSAIRKWDDLAGTGVRRVALSNPDSVPSGRNARETLERRHLWLAVQPKAVFGQNVRQTLAYVARGEVDAGIVFASDAAIERGRLRVAQFAVPGLDHAPIVYPAAVVAGSRHAALAKRFVAFLRSPVAQADLASVGFTSLAPVRKK